MSESKHRIPPYKRPIIVIGFLVALVAVVVVTIIVFKNLNTDTNPSHLPGSDSGTEQSTGDKDPESPPSKPEDKAPAYEGGDPNELDELTGTIVYVDIDPDNQALHSAVSINQYLHADGQCVFNLKRADGTIVHTASAVATPDVTTSVCGPFTISVADLSPGTYQIEVILTGDNKRGIITSSVTL